MASASNGSDDIYAGFFGLTCRPFSMTPNPDFLVWSRQYMQAFTVLEFGVMSRAPITLLTGDVGAGKTTLVQALLKRLPDDLRVGLVSNAQGDRREILEWVMTALGLELVAGESYVQAFRRLQEMLIAEYAAGRHVLLIVDEAQNLGREALEELRMLTNINANQDELIQLILVGQPELRTRISQPDMLQFAQRIAASFHLNRLDAEQTAEIITHRLRSAEGTGEEITPEAIALIHETTGGVPRLINQLCDLAMLYAWSERSPQVGIEHVRQILSDGVFLGGRSGATFSGDA